MLELRFQFGWLRKRTSALTAAVTLALFAGSVPLLALPEIRSAEASENGSPNERTEDSTIATRVHSEREFLEFHRGSAAFLQPAQPALGHAQRPVLDPPAGHRLANGLLAPMTC